MNFMDILGTVVQIEALGIVFWLAIGYIVKILLGEKWHKHVAVRLAYKAAKGIGADTFEDYPLIEKFILEFKKSVGRAPNGDELQTAMKVREEVLENLKKSEA